MDNKDITKAVQCWNRLFKWSAKKCNDVEEGKKVGFLLLKVLKILKAHPGYNEIDKNYLEVHTELLKEMEDFKEKHIYS